MLRLHSSCGRALARRFCCPGRKKALPLDLRLKGEVRMRIIDPHIHLWDLETGLYPGAGDAVHRLCR
jgi:hypothetical protein